MHQQNTSDRRNVHHEDRFGEHKRAIQHKIYDAVPQNFNEKGHWPHPTHIGQRSAMMMMMAASFADPHLCDLASFFGLFFAFF